MVLGLLLLYPVGWGYYAKFWRDKSPVFMGCLAVLGWSGGLTGSCVGGEGLRLAGAGGMGCAEDGNLAHSTSLRASPAAALRPSGAEVWFAVGRGVGIVLGLLAEAAADWVVVDVTAVGEEVVAVAHASVGKASLPDWELRGHAAREASFDELDGTLEGDVLWREEEMDVVRHDDEGVEFVVAFVAVVLEGFEQEFGCGCNLEEVAAIVGLGADEEGSVACCSGGDSHRFPSLPQRLKPPGWGGFMARLKPCPFEGRCGGLDRVLRGRRWAS